MKKGSTEQLGQGVASLENLLWETLFGFHVKTEKAATCMEKAPGLARGADELGLGKMSEGRFKPHQRPAVSVRVRQDRVPPTKVAALQLASPLNQP